MKLLIKVLLINLKSETHSLYKKFLVLLFNGYDLGFCLAENGKSMTDKNILLLTCPAQ